MIMMKSKKTVATKHEARFVRFDGGGVSCSCLVMVTVFDCERDLSIYMCIY